MNIQDAIKSGKRFRRKSSSNKDYYSHLILRMELPIGDILADDWEVEPTTVTINRQQFNAAWDRAVLSLRPDVGFTNEVLARELGL